MRVFVDTNVLLDVLLKREPWLAHSASLWSLAESGRLEAHISAVSFTTCWYLVRRYGDLASATSAVKLLRDTFRIVDLSAQILSQAIDSSIPDFEDAVQFHSALRCDAKSLVTRNPAHFPKKPLNVLAPDQFLVASGLA